MNNRLEYLYDRWTREACTEAEKDELMTLIDDPGNRAALEPLIDKTIQASGETSDLPDHAPAQILEAIFSAKNHAVVPMPTTRHRIRWIRAVAVAVFLLLATGVYFIFLRHKTLDDTRTMDIVVAPGKDLAPGSNKAILTLSNGSNIILDSTHTGTLAQQGIAKVLQVANGQLAYQLSPAADNPYQRNHPDPEVFNTLTTPNGGQYRLDLPDGSKVWLNAASSIRYPTAFTGKDRTVTITGEAYFEVAPNSRQPFVVRLDHDISVQVLGTRFNIMAYADEALTRTSLLDGAVKLNRGGSSLVLAPGQQARVQQDCATCLIERVEGADLDEALAWKEGRFQFHGADIQAILRQLARWYDVTIDYEGEKPATRISGIIDRNVNLSSVLRMLALSGVHVHIEGKKIIVKS